jgi:hypothetical protein
MDLVVAAVAQAVPPEVCSCCRMNIHRQPNAEPLFKEQRLSEWYSICVECYKEVPADLVADRNYRRRWDRRATNKPKDCFVCDRPSDDNPYDPVRALCGVCTDPQRHETWHYLRPERLNVCQICTTPVGQNNWSYGWVRREKPRTTVQRFYAVCEPCDRRGNRVIVPRPQWVAALHEIEAFRAGKIGLFAGRRT